MTTKSTATPEGQRLEEGRKLFACPCSFVLAAAQTRQFPPTKLPEIAFVGRSNVGKSSLINALVNRKNLARASVTPGRTQQIVFFDLGGRMMLADLPGYGYAKAPLQQREEWAALTESYLRNRPNLRCVLLLIDGRHGVRDNDLGTMTLLDRAAISYRLVLTKADKVRAAELEMRIAGLREAIKPHPAAHPEILAVSAEKNEGMSELRARLAVLATA